MLARPTLKRAHHLVSIAIAVTLAGLASVAFARVVRNTIDPVASVSGAGRRILVTGPVECTGGERFHLRVTVTQRSTGAVAEGRSTGTCTGETQQWKVDASIRGSAAFEEGPATAVAVDRTTDGGGPTDAHQWLVEITLVGE